MKLRVSVSNCTKNKNLKFELLRFFKNVGFLQQFLGSSPETYKKQEKIQDLQETRKRYKKNL